MRSWCCLIGEQIAMSDLEYALSTINKVYQQTLSSGHDTCIVQLTNDNQGFSCEVINQLKTTPLSFKLPTHISVLPAGKRESSSKLFDGLEDVYCNCSQLKQIIERMKQQPIKQKKGIKLN